MIKELQNIFDEHFKFLTEDLGFLIDSSYYDSNAFGNFSVNLSKGQKKIRLVSDKSQIFVEIFTANFGWRDKEDILGKKGILKNRFNTVNGLWDGYEIQNQSADLKKYIPFLFD